jgi:hypothetical protein
VATENTESAEESDGETFMLRSTADLAGLAIHATDGDIGSVEDIYFDDIHWRVRYLVVDTGNWLPGRLVLISPAAIEKADVGNHRLDVKLSRTQVENSPGIEAHETVSRQHELKVAKYYGWLIYWPLEATLATHVTEDEARGDSNLRSVGEVRGYHVHAQDGDLGHVVDFLIDERIWEVRYLVVGTGKWLPGKKVLLDPRAAEGIDWAKSAVRVKLSQAEIKSSPQYDPTGAREAADKAHLEAYKRWPTYWY